MSSEPLTEARFWAQVLTDSQRTIVCPPDLEDRIRSWIDAADLAGQYKVVASLAVPDGQMIVVDEHAVEAAHRKRLTTRPRWH